MSIKSEIVKLADPLVGERVTSDEVPSGGLDFPYVRVLDNITETPALRGDARMMASRRLVQVDVFQRLADESDDVVDDLLDTIDGKPAEAGLRFVWTGTARIVDTDAGVVQHSMTFTVARLRP